MRWLIISFIVAALASAVAAVTFGPLNYMKAILLSPQGLVLVGRIMMVYNILYPATGDIFLSAFAAILFNNAVGLAAVLASPPLIHSSYTMRGRTRWKLFIWPGNKFGWGFYRKAIYTVALMYVTAFGIVLSAAVAVQGFSAFMPFEAGYIFLAAYTVYKSSQTDAEGFKHTYGTTLRRYLPAIILLLVVAALVEAYEAL